ncbi:MULTISPECIES: hypothetical protein [Enterobacter cloacae complex]|uniref:hypothetical protein n=1 Tax=Enterobacter cloacae complex TaxID=354276 RepID=UPI000AD1CAF0|nr:MULTISPECIES: hypothetical protein [Enterobacter cloacae complex]HCD6061389.1 hypothetical protein [Enterobacter asburiae]HDS9658297.1 hypothetical protein [Klebsiella pneumoniae subsp. pneumoniae]EKV8997252.1 hypothetical protein [Enterobacter hormaechei]MBW7732889.1 hypothetical protein [Enterobacter hormaechei]MCL8169783.1 hypothetical protein [Enterobacter kobei]
MIKQSKRITSDKAMAGAKRSLDFWSSIDGNKLAKVGQKEKDMDMVGPKKGVKPVSIG